MAVLVRVVIWIGIGLALFLIFGCATEEQVRQEVCFERFMGRTDQGDNVVMHACMTPEAFAEAQKR